MNGPKAGKHCPHPGAVHEFYIAQDYGHYPVFFHQGQQVCLELKGIAGVNCAVQQFDNQQIIDGFTFKPHG
jgi:hypothetical protein